MDERVKRPPIETGAAEILAGIMEGRADADAGRLIPHDVAMDKLDAVIEAARQALSKRNG